MGRPVIATGLSLLCALGAAATAVGGESGARTIDAASIIEQYRGTKMRPDEVRTALPTTPNPWTSLRPEGAAVDWAFWEAKRYQMAMDKAAQNKPAKVRLTGIGGNATQKISQFGTGPSQANTVQVSGEFTLPPASSFVPDAEDEGSIPLASETGLTAGNAIVADGVIGDGPFGLAGTGSGDFDFYAIRGVSAGTTIVVDVDTELPFDPLDPAVAVYAADGNIVAFNDDSGGTFDSFVSVEVPADGDYFVSIGTFGNPVLNDPFDSSSGNGVEMSFFPEGNEGAYTVTIGLDYFDERVFAFTPKKGDVIGAAVNGAPAELILIDTHGHAQAGFIAAGQQLLQHRLAVAGRHRERRPRRRHARAVHAESTR